MANEDCAVKSAAGGRAAAGGDHGLPPGRLSVLVLIYGIGTWLQFLLLSALGLPVLLLLPRLRQRRALVRGLARMALRLAGMRLDSRGLERLPQPCIVVANHCSYLDGVVLCASLPASFSFVIKREMAAVPLAGTLLRRIGAEFVTRSDRVHGARDARRLLRQAQTGQALVFFPEGTFGTEVGLRHFHIGAFAAATRARLPLVPVTIRGTRRCLPPGSPWPRPGTIRIDVLAAFPAQLPPAAGAGPGGREPHDPKRAVQLRDAARGVLLAALGEPDLDPGAPH